MTELRKDAESAAGLEWPGLGLASLIYFGLALLYFIPAFMPGNHLYGSDYLAAGYFSHEFISERLAAGALPKWVPYIYGGVPWFANPGSTYYPFRFLVDLVVAPHQIFAAFYVIQFTIAGIGAYLLSRELEVRRWVAFVGGLAFMFTGLIMSFVLAGHEGRIIVATYAPLFLFFLHRGVRTGVLAPFAGAALTLGFSLLSFQIQSNYYLLLLGAAWGVFAIVRTGVRGARPVAGRVGLGLAAVAAGFLLASINFLPFLDYVDASPRGGPGRGYEYATSWSMPPAEVTGFALPEQAGLLELYQGDNPFKLHTEYAGVLVLLLVALGVVFSRRDRYWWFFVGAAVVGLTFAFGGYTPIYRLYYAILPGTTRFRAPSISLFVVSLALVMMATLTLEHLARLRSARGEAGGEPPDRVRTATWVIGAIVAVALMIMVVASGLPDPRGQALSRGAFRLFAFSALIGATLWAWLRHHLGARVALVALSVLTVADLWIVDRRFFQIVEAPATMMARDDVVDFLLQQPGPFRVWVLPDNIPAGQRAYGGGLKNYLMRFDIAQAGGEHGNQLQRYNEFVGAGETTYVDWHNFLADLQGLIDPNVPGANPSPNFLAAANIRYIISTVLLPGLEEAYRGRTGVVYRIPQAQPRAFLVDRVIVAPEPDGALEILQQPDFSVGQVATVYEPLETPLPDAPGPAAGEAEIVEYEPDRLVVRTRAAGPALLVVADNHYPGWHATVDGEEAPIHLTNHAFRGVPVPAGEHEVVLEFRPPDFYTGAWISLLTLIALVGVAGATLLRQRQSGRAAEVP